MKNFLILLSISILFLKNTVANDVLEDLTLDMSFEEIFTRCKSPDENEEATYFEDYNYNEFSHINNNQWFIDREGMKRHFNELYNSNKRLSGRAYYSPEHQSIVIPLANNTTEFAKVPKRFIKSTIFHIEEALKSGYAEYVFFTDMGHNHFFLHSKAYDQIMKEHGNSKAILYTKLFNEPSLKMLYHTAEKLILDLKNGSNDPFEYRRHRLLTRNIIGDNNEKGILEILYNYDEGGNYNTVREYKEKYYKSYSSGIYLQGSKNGCFPYRHNGKTYFFDINVNGLPTNNNYHDDY